MKHILTFVFLHTLFTTFGQSGLRITEFMPHPGQSLSFSGPENTAWLEMTNYGNQPVDAGQFKIRISGTGYTTTVSLQVQTILPGQAVLYRFNHSNESDISELPVNIETGTESFYLINGEDMVEDSLVPANPVRQNEVWVRNALSGRWSIFPGYFATPAELNSINSNWNKLASTTALPAADSDPNACLSYHGKIWIFGGWTFHEPTQSFGSVTYLWNSDDGVHWNKISDSLPFTHYSSFIVFRDTIRVFTNYNIYSTVDGINWEISGNVPYEFFGTTSRLTVMNDKLFFIDTAVSGFSTNGIDFTISRHNIPPRNYGSIKALNGKLYFMGGQNLETGVYYNDVWVSDDGLTWNQLVEHAPWKPRKWFMSEIYQNKIWIFGGFNLSETHPEEGYANHNDIWFSEDGINWQSYTPLNPWPIRHAAYHTLKGNEIFMIAGYDNGEVNGLFNDVWTFEITNYYLKPGGDVNNRQDWSSTREFDGPGPENFNEDLINYHLSSPGHFLLDKPFAVTNSTCTLIVGDGVGETTVEILPQSNQSLKVMVLPGSTLMIKNLQPDFKIIPQPRSHVIFQACPKLKLPTVAYANLTLDDVRIIQTDTIGVSGHFYFNQLNLSGTVAPELTVNLGGTLTIGERTGPGLLRVIGTHSADQEIFTWNQTEQKTGNLELIKPTGNFIIRNPIQVDYQLKVSQKPD